MHYQLKVIHSINNQIEIKNIYKKIYSTELNICNKSANCPCKITNNKYMSVDLINQYD